MTTTDKTDSVNLIVKQYFTDNPDVQTVLAKELMPLFVRAGIFAKDVKDGLPIRELLRALDKEQNLHLIPQALPVRKAINTNWVFCRAK